MSTVIPRTKTTQKALEEVRQLCWRAIYNYPDICKQQCGDCYIDPGWILFCMKDIQIRVRKIKPRTKSSSQLTKTPKGKGRRIKRRRRRMKLVDPGKIFVTKIITPGRFKDFIRSNKSIADLQEDIFSYMEKSKSKPYSVGFVFIFSFSLIRGNNKIDEYIIPIFMS